MAPHNGPHSVKREQAALLVAEGDLTEGPIAQTVGIGVRTLRRWRSDDAFQRRVAEIREVIADRILRQGIARREMRVAALNRRWEQMQQVIEARGMDPSLTHVPGGSTGLLTVTLKVASNGDSFPEYAVDTALLRELRAHEQQAAQELGQWATKSEVSGDVLVRQYIGVAIEDV